MQLLNALEKKFSVEAFERICRRVDEFKKAGAKIVQYFQSINKGNLLWVQFQSTLNKQLEKEAGKFRLESFSFRSTVFIKIVSHCFTELNESNLQISKQIKLEVLSRIESISEQLVEPCISTLKKYRVQEQQLDQQARRYHKHQKALSGSLKNYRDCLIDPLYTFNQPQQNKRLKMCRQSFGMVKHSQRELVILSVKLNEIKLQFVKVVSQLCQNFQQCFFQFVQQFCSLIKRKIGVFMESMRHLCLDAIASFRYLTQSSMESYPLEFSGQDFFATVNGRQIQDLTTEDILSFSHFMQKEFEILKTFQPKHNLTRKMILANVQAFNVMLDKYRKMAGLEVSNFAKIQKKVADLFGSKMVEVLNSFTLIMDNTNKVLQKLSKVLISKTVVIAQSVGQLPKSFKILHKELQRIQVDHGQARREFQRKKGLPAQPNALIDRQANKYEGFEGDITRLMKDSINQKILMISHLLKQHNQRQSKAAIAVKQSVEDWVRQILDFTQLIKENSENAEAQLLTNFQTSSKSRRQQIRNIILKDPSLALVTAQIQSKTIDCKFEETPQMLEIKQIDQKEHNKNEQEIQNSPKQQFVQQQKPAPANPDGIQSSFDNEAELIKLKQFLTSKFKFQPGEKLMSNYSCAFSQKILLQGRLYITNKRLFFHSMFNSSNIFFGQTILNIHKKEIIKVQKKSFIFNNLLELRTAKGNVLFTSLFNRDQALGIINRVFQLEPKQDVQIESKEILEMEQVEPVSGVLFDGSQQEIKSRGDKLREIVQLQMKETKEIGRFTIKNCPMKLFVDNVFLKADLLMPDKSTGGFFTRLRFELGQTEINVPKWQPSQPTLGILQPLLRSSSWIHPIENTGVPFTPKQVKINEQAKFYLVDNKSCYYIIHIYSSGAPYTDCFWVRLVYEFKENQKHVEMAVYHQTVFLKSPFIKGIIQKKSLEEAVVGSKIIYQKIASFIYGEKKKMMKTTAAVVNQVQTQPQEIPENYELKRLESVINELKQKVQGRDKVIKILAGALVAVLALLMMRM